MHRNTVRHFTDRVAGAAAGGGAAAATPLTVTTPRLTVPLILTSLRLQRAKKEAEKKAVPSRPLESLTFDAFCQAYAKKTPADAKKEEISSFSDPLRFDCVMTHFIIKMKSPEQEEELITLLQHEAIKAFFSESTLSEIIKTVIIKTVRCSETRKLHSHDALLRFLLLDDEKYSRFITPVNFSDFSDIGKLDYIPVFQEVLSRLIQTPGILRIIAAQTYFPYGLTVDEDVSRFISLHPKFAYLMLDKSSTQMMQERTAAIGEGCPVLPNVLWSLIANFGKNDYSQNRNYVPHVPDYFPLARTFLNLKSLPPHPPLELKETLNIKMTFREMAPKAEGSTHIFTPHSLNSY